MTTVYRDANAAFLGLLAKVMNQGNEIPSRNGNTLELPMEHFTILRSGGVTLPERKASLPAQIAETMWVLSGRNDIGWLKRYLPRAADFSDDGETWRAGYGPRLRTWGEEPEQTVDQLAYVVDELRADPESRRAVMSIWDPSTDSLPGLDVPCNNWLHFISRYGRLNLHVATRSNDLMWGWSGINVFEWSTLLQVVASLTGLQPGSITFSVSSLHIYEHHYARARRILATASSSPLHAEPMPMLRLPESIRHLDELDAWIGQWFSVEQLIREERWAEARVAIDEYPIPVWRLWLRVLFDWARGTEELVNSVPMIEALKASPRFHIETTKVKDGDFAAFAANLHREKNAAYGDSWQKRGEMLGIMANIARKVDRLGVAGAGDTAADTAIDLLIYLIKYRAWLLGCRSGGAHLDFVADELQRQQELTRFGEVQPVPLVQSIRDRFETLEHRVEEHRNDRADLVAELIALTFPLAQHLWRKEEAWKAGNATRRFNGYAMAGE